MAGIVPDANVVAKWFLGDEDLVAQAIAVRDALRDGGLEGIAPDHLLYEVGQTLVKAIRRDRLASERIVPALEALTDFGLELVRFDGLRDTSVSLALELGVSLYDAAYVAVSEGRAATFVTADRRLYETASAAGYDVVWLGDIPA